MILLPIDGECVIGPIGRDFSRRIDHDVPIRKVPFALVATLDAPVDDAPSVRRINRECHRIRFMVHDIHEQIAAIEIRVMRVELREGPRQIIAVDFVSDRGAVCVVH